MPHLLSVQKLLNFNQGQSSKYMAFLVNSLWTRNSDNCSQKKASVTNFGLQTSAIEFPSLDNILLVGSWADIMTSQPLLQNNFVLMKPVVDNYTDIIKMLIKTIL